MYIYIYKQVELNNLDEEIRVFATDNAARSSFPFRILVVRRLDRIVTYRHALRPLFELASINRDILSKCRENRRCVVRSMLASWGLNNRHEWNVIRFPLGAIFVCNSIRLQILKVDQIVSNRFVKCRRQRKKKREEQGIFFSLPHRFYARKFFSLRKKTCATSPCRAVQITGNTVTYNAALATQHQRLESPCPVVCRLFRVTLPPPLFKNMQQETGLAVRSSTPFNRVYGRAMKKKIYL